MGKCKFGFIYGSFDMFEVRDINGIELAKDECEKLIIGVFSDEMYEKYHNKKPVISVDKRIEIAQSVKGVYCVIEISSEEELKQLVEAGNAELKKGNESSESKIKQEIKNKIEKSLAKKSEEKKEDAPKKYKLGFIQGTFDMFHYGHLNIIKKASELCDKIIVGLNEDELVKEYKHKTPIVNFENRKKVLESIEGVDGVIPMSDRSIEYKTKVIKEIGADAMIMGDDWRGKDIYQNEFEKKLGIGVEYIEYTKGISSTDLRRKIGKDDNGNDIKKEDLDAR